MIVVFCQNGGEKLLGKARELADASGDRVLALLQKDETDAQSLIYLGADEVLTSSANGVLSWTNSIIELVKSDSKIQSIIFPSNLFCNAIMGGVYASLSERVGTFYDNAELFDGSSVSRSHYDMGVASQKRLVENELVLVSMKLASVPTPFEDSSRYGKIKDMQYKPDLDDDSLGSIADYRSSSDSLTILLGSEDQELRALAEKVAEKYHASLEQLSGAVQVVYGPCLAIEVKSRLRDLPEFKGQLISINILKAPISTISDSSAITESVAQVLEALL